MKGRINSDGEFLVEKLGAMRYQICPFKKYETSKCGLHCPHFLVAEIAAPLKRALESAKRGGIPEDAVWAKLLHDEMVNIGAVVSICQNASLKFNELELPDKSVLKGLDIPGDVKDRLGQKAAANGVEMIRQLFESITGGESAEQEEEFDSRKRRVVH